MSLNGIPIGTWKCLRDIAILWQWLTKLEKAYDKTPRNIMSWALEKHKVPAKYIGLIKDIYRNVVTSVQTSLLRFREKKCSNKWWSHGWLFDYIILRVSFEPLPFCLGDGWGHKGHTRGYPLAYVSCTQCSANWWKLLELWLETLESKGSRLNRTKIEYMRCKRLQLGKYPQGITIPYPYPQRKNSPHRVTHIHW